MKPQVIQSISGGMDSTCLALHHLAAGREVHLLSFDYGQKHRLELDRLDANLAIWQGKGLPVTHRRVSVPFGVFASSALTDPAKEQPHGYFAAESMKQTVVPNRNAIFSAIGFSFALSHALACGQEVSLSLGVHAGDHDIYPDCRLPFFERLHAAFVDGNWGGEQVKLDLPFLTLDKAAILRGALASCATLGLDFDEALRNTSTSYAPTAEGFADGRTGSDVERILAFHEIGRADPVAYVGGWASALENALRVRDEFLTSH